VLLLIDFRNLRDCLLALLPPLAGTALMFGLLGLFDIDLNPANLIVLPLVVGLGVDGGVHVIHDFRSRSQLGTYTPSASVINAILVNSTTTMVGFGSMMIAAHRGLYSLGLVLTIGVGTCLLVSIVMVPAILTWITRGRAVAQPAVAREALAISSETLPVHADELEQEPDVVQFLRRGEIGDDDDTGSPWRDAG
jgi:predicted RND superfamily exporter protein